MKNSGFSLVELSIVLVILGLLVGGILAGQSLIRASELRAVGTEYNRWITATNAFKDKYFGLPGDLSNAVSFWGQSTACGGSAANGTCNGNGDGTFTVPAATGQTGEIFQYWRHLALAGLIEGNYTGVADNGSALHSTFGVNIPGSKLTSAGWGIETRGYFVGNGTMYTLDYGNDFYVGAAATAERPYLPTILFPEEAWNIDVKNDDGMPLTGKIVNRSYCGLGACSCTTATAANDYTATYRLNATPASIGKPCGLYFPRAF